MPTLDTPAATLRGRFPTAVLEIREFRGETTVIVAPDALLDLLRHCRDELGFDTLLDLSSLDHFGQEPRFELVYELYSLQNRQHLRLRSPLTDSANPEAASATPLWPTANWHEREIWDMMGIRFRGHPDLTRILMWEGFPYFPLRKDFPLAGKSSDLPDVAFSNPAPLQGGPFVTSPGGDVVSREPRGQGF